ncbi:MAG TPA: hypothetical protein VIT22_01985, partial [Pseudoxanthomonas sp.]
MTREDRPAGRTARRQFLGIAAAAASAPIFNSAASGPFNASTARAQPAPSVVRTADRRRPNILFVFTDQERYFPSLPPGLSLPGHE